MLDRTGACARGHPRGDEAAFGRAAACLVIRACSLIAESRVDVDQPNRAGPAEEGDEAFGLAYRLSEQIGLASRWIAAAHQGRCNRCRLQTGEQDGVLVRLLYERDRGRERVIGLFTVLDWIMAVSDALEDRPWQDIEAFEGKGTC